jgi:hypothetical protein
MWFLLRAVAIVAVIAFLSPYRGGAERETARLAAEAPERILAQVPPDARERAVAAAAEAALRGALAPVPPSPGSR